MFVQQLLTRGVVIISEVCLILAFYGVSGNAGPVAGDIYRHLSVVNAVYSVTQDNLEVDVYQVYRFDFLDKAAVLIAFLVLN